MKREGNTLTGRAGFDSGHDVINGAASVKT